MISSRDLRRARGWVGVSTLALAAALTGGQALAQTAQPGEAMATAPAGPPPATSTPSQAGAPAQQPSEIMAINLIHLLVRQGVITADAADALIREAEAQTQQARANAAEAQASLPPPANGVIRIPYVPEVVRNQIRDDVKRDVLAAAESEARSKGWAGNAVPEWVNRFTFFGEFRFRDEFDLYSKNNASDLIDYSTFNSGGPIDVNAVTNPNGLPFLNTRVNRLDQISLRAKFGFNVDIYDGVRATVRLATGSDTSPVSTTQLLGGGLGKKDIWLDQAYLSLTPVNWVTINVGRNPDFFEHTSLLFDDNLNFDGIVVTGTKTINDDGLRLFGVTAAVPLQYVSSNFPTNGTPSNGVPKANDSTKWLYAIQAGLEYKPDPQGWSARGALSFYDFENVQGQLSTPCDTYAGIRQCSTDSSAPAFMQKGNTLFLIRDIAPNPSSPTNYAQPQLVGLAYNYRVLDITGEVEAPLWGAIRGQLQADYARNLAYTPGQLQQAYAANPLLTPVTNTDGITGAYQSGPNAWQIKATIGALRPSAKGDWNLAAGYKYIEPDAVLDAFNDHDFHMGGTNAKGYFLYASYYFANNTWLDARWFSANEVFGSPYAIDVLQLEVQTKF